jgi:iron(III) transport system ATP-binding protein
MNPPGNTNYLQVEKVTKKFGKFTALRDVSFTAQPGEFISVLGPSGCGKTTLLRMVAGLEPLTRGRILIQDRDVSNLPVSRRNVGIVFQSYALFPNLSAADNVAYGLRGRNSEKTAIRRRVRELLELVGLSGIGAKYPAQLSGGQQQRVALARAMALSPDLLLLDEPLSALDAKVRIMLRSEIRQLQQRLGVTTIMVTHDQEEALTMADRILVISEGELVQNGTPTDIYDRPATPFVASFIGSMNFISEAVKVGDGCYQIGEKKLMISGENGSQSLPAGHAVTLAIRPEDIMVHADGENESNRFQARVKEMEYRGPLFRISLGLPLQDNLLTTIDADVTAEKVRRFKIQANTFVPIHLPQDRLRVYGQHQVSA